MKNLVLSKIAEDIELAKISKNQLINMLMKDAKKAFDSQMEFKKKELAKMEKALDSSKELTEREGDDWPSRWVRTDFSKLIDVDNDLEKEMLKDYLQENFSIDADFENDAVSTSLGPCLIVNEDGDVLDQDSSKWIIKRSDYTTKEERNELIEKYMETSGYFPSVVSYGRYGVQGYISTQK